MQAKVSPTQEENCVREPSTTRVLSSTIVLNPEVSPVAAPADVSGHESSSISVPAAELNHVADHIGPTWTWISEVIYYL
jgi:hypothetical protein